MANPRKPRLPNAGTPMSLSMIANEFELPLSNVRMSDYKRGGNIVRNIITNRNIAGVGGTPAPLFPPIKLSQFYGATFFLFWVRVDVTGESTHKYNWENNGSIKVTIWGVEDSYNATIKAGKGIGSTYRNVGSSPSASANINSDGGSHTFNNLNYGQYQLSVKDNAHHSTGLGYDGPFNFNVTVNYGNGSGGSVRGIATGSKVQLVGPGSPTSGPVIVTPPAPTPTNNGIESMDVTPAQLVHFGWPGGATPVVGYEINYFV